MARTAGTMNSLAEARYLSDARGEVVAIEQVVGHQASPIWRLT
jgi:hypothetical protein